MSRNARKTHSRNSLRKALQALWLSKVATNPTQKLWRFWQSAADTMWLKTGKIDFPRDKRHYAKHVCARHRSRAPGEKNQARKWGNKSTSILIAGTIFFSRPLSYWYINSCLYTMTQIPDTTERAWARHVTDYSNMACIAAPMHEMAQSCSHRPFSIAYSSLPNHTVEACTLFRSTTLCST